MCSLYQEKPTQAGHGVCNGYAGQTIFPVCRLSQREEDYCRRGQVETCLEIRRLNHNKGGGMENCGTCRYWSEMIACSSGGKPIEALCLSDTGPYANRMVTENNI